MRILAIETSCDETAITIVDLTGPKSRPVINILSNIISSQVKLHAKFGGVVPNLAKREHQRNLVPVLLHALKEAKLLKISKSKFLISKQIPKFKNQKNLETILSREPELLKKFLKYILRLPAPEIDVIAVTIGPGLAPALWVGVNFVKALAYLWEKPLIPINHMEGHLFSALLERKNSKSEIRNPKQIPNHKSKILNNLELRISNLEFPAIALLVSGGHTELVLVKNYGKYKIIGETLDDAAGEAFDKVARILGLGYPGGPEIAKLAEKGNPNRYKLPSPMINSQDYNFSFSGLKTAVFYLIRDVVSLASHKLEARRRTTWEAKLTTTTKTNVAASFQKAIVNVLVKKTIRAAKEYKVKTVLLGGGVTANKLLRRELKNELTKELPEADCWTPEAALAGDNALMIALAAYFAGKKTAWRKVHADANIRLS